MTDTVQQSFCERCGTRYTFTEQVENPENSSSKLGLFKRRGAQDESAEPEVATAPPSSEGFASTFHFCLECRQYACENCWNGDLGYCVGCRPPGAPAPEVDKPSGSGFAAFSASSFGAASTAKTASDPTSWPTGDLGQSPTTPPHEHVHGESGSTSTADINAGATSTVRDDAPTPDPDLPWLRDDGGESSGSSGFGSAAAASVDEWGRPTESQPRVTSPVVDEAPAPTPAPTADPWRGVAFTEDDAATDGNDELGTGGSQTLTEADPSAWPDRDRSPSTASDVEADAAAWPEVDQPTTPMSDPAEVAVEPDEDVGTDQVADASVELDESSELARADEIDVPAESALAGVISSATDDSTATDVPDTEMIEANEEAPAAVAEPHTEMPEDAEQAGALAIDEDVADAEAPTPEAEAADDMADEPGSAAQAILGAAAVASVAADSLSDEAVQDEAVAEGAVADAVVSDTDAQPDAEPQIEALVEPATATLSFVEPETETTDPTLEAAPDDAVEAVEVAPPASEPMVPPGPNVETSPSETPDSVEPVAPEPVLVPVPPPPAPAVEPAFLPLPSLTTPDTTQGPFSEPYAALPSSAPAEQPSPAPSPLPPVAPPPAGTLEPAAVQPVGPYLPPMPQAPLVAPSAAVPPPQPPMLPPPPPIGAAAVPPVQMPGAPRPAATSAGRVPTQGCPNCGLALSAKARFCRRCGSPQV